jgi:hypothetical protein
MRVALFAAVAVALATPVQAQPSAAGCGELVTIPTHGRTTTRYALAQPTAAKGSPVVLMLLVGGGGHLNLDASGCPRALKGNFLVRSLEHFRAHGFATALVDAPSDHPGEDGLKSFRVTPAHGDDLGRITADLHKRTGQRVWIVGTSRGTISAVNAASRLSGAAAADGVVLTSAITSPGSGGKRPWAAQSVFDLPLQAIKMPVLVVGHAADKCPRTPASLMGRITARTNGVREQTVTVTGGSGGNPVGLAACQGRTPHGFLGQEAEVAAGIARFVRGGAY